MERKHGQAGGVLVLVLVAIVAIAGAGAWNYRRNLQAEEQRTAARPLHGYATSDLEALAAAYKQEIGAREGRYEAAKKTHAEAKDRAYFDEQVQEFEKVQKQSGKKREAGAEVAMREVDLARIEEELRARHGTESDFDRQMRLLLTF
jgi:hypothetical protein